MTVVNKIMKLLTEPRYLWSFALYVENSPVANYRVLSAPRKLFDSTGLKLWGVYPDTQADPFLFSYDDTLYVFFELVFPGEYGRIAAYCTNDMQTFRYLGIVLQEKHHLSFPFIFQLSDSVYLVPESSINCEVSLYKFDIFPTNVRKFKTLLSGNYCDSFLYKKDETWFLFTTSPQGLELYFSDDVLRADFQRHPSSPINSDPRYSRSGGKIIEMDRKILRVAQDCSTTYGRNLNLVEIVELSRTTYREKIASVDLLTLGNHWNREGSHHLSTAYFREKYVLVIDGKRKDMFINKISVYINKFLEKKLSFIIKRRL